MPTVSVRDIALYYEAHGRSDGEPLVLLHGFNARGQRMLDLHLPHFGGRYRLIVPDWRGHGRTTNPAGAIHHAELARDLAAFAGALGLRRAHFCGHSSGGMQLLFLALERPELVHTLTLSSATYIFDAHAQARVRERAANALAQQAQLRQSGQAREGEAADWEQRRRLIEQWAESVQRPGELPFTPDDLRAIRCPTLIVHGDRDVFFPVHIPVTMYRAMPEAELCILPRCGHGGPYQSPIIYTAALREFLARNPLPAGD
jgi:pimeloyl-ACP methyl ester carboxylesterase